MKSLKILSRLSLGAQLVASRLPGHRPTLYYVVPKVNWSTDWDGRYITQGVQRQFGLRAHLTDRPRWLAGQIVHYGSLWEAVAGLGAEQTSRNAIVATIFHGDRNGASPALAQALDRVLEHQTQFDTIVVSNSIMEGRFRVWGFPQAKLANIPLGVDTALFRPTNPQARAALRQRLGIAKDAFCVGSFHKDGVGWEEGLEPKLIKGPDILLDVLTRLAKQHRIHVLLTAPARGYVKQGLEKAGIPYTHKILDRYPDVAPLFNALDAYLVTSREEGGPKGVLESMASGVPVVSTRVGLAPDVVQDGGNGLLADSEDVEALLDHLAHLIDDRPFAAHLAEAGLAKIPDYDWSRIAAQYYAQVYQPLLPT
jgi:glycosyltransferase involved in cell wall biosynthesis